MCGEIGMKIRQIELRKFKDGYYEATFYNEDGTFLHIIGDNDLKSLFEDAIRNIKEIKC